MVELLIANGVDMNIDIDNIRYLWSMMIMDRSDVIDVVSGHGAHEK